MSDAADPAVNPWPGLASYTEDQRHLFFGRTAETNEMVRLVQRETLTVLFGRSGLGKSSLLRAGVMPRLRENGFFPVTLRLDFSERAEVNPVEQFKALTVAAARQAGIEVEGLPADGAAGLTLWEWFHTVAFWGPRNDPVIPILALDQFEEVFTLGRNLRPTEGFLEQLADLIENRVPPAVRQRVERSGERLACDATRQDYKVVLSLREDFVPKLDSLRPVLPAIMRNRFALAPLDAECACAVVLGAGRTWIAEDDAKEIVAAVVGGDGPLTYRPDEEVEPAYLSVMCHELFRRMQTLGRDTITRDLIAAERGGILEGLYTRSFEGIGDPVRFFVEDRLLTPSGFRGTLPLADATQEGIAAADLHTLVDRRLLRFEDRLGTIHLELSHDLLTGIVLKRREARRAEAALKLETERAGKLRAAQLAQRRRARLLAGVAVALGVLLIGTLWGGYYCFVQEHRAYYRGFAKRRGIAEGIGELSAAEASRLPVHYALLYKGIVWDGWRPHWRPPFLMLALDGRGALTTHHSVGTYLWHGDTDSPAADLNKDRSASLGLAAVCQWEYVPDAQGGIAYERALDRNGNMVWGCAYSPTAAGLASTRIAHFVGPDGFPQLQHDSAAEYIEIHYDENGWEERIRFLDAMARPAAGPDGAFGLAREFDRLGNTTVMISLDESGQPMIDRAGNAGLRLTYDHHGLTTEMTSLGLDRQVFAVSDGWARIVNRYDAAGRLVLTQSFDANNQLVIRRSNVCQVTSAYDASGDLVTESYLGPDGQDLPIVGNVVTIKHDHDGEGNEIRTTFLDPAGHPSRLSDGSCGYESRYDDSRNLVARTVFGPDGQPFLLADGYAGWKSEFNNSGKETRREYLGLSGEPVRHREGNHGWEKEYDARGNPIRYIYLGLDGRPSFVTGQIAGWEAGFDPRGREVSRSYFGAGREPVLHADGYHGYATVYDERGYTAEITFLDLLGKPVALGNNYATERFEHDSHGRETKRTYFDAAGAPVAHKDGYHGLLYRYDARGNVIETTTVGLDDMPVVTKANGYATERKGYDLRGNVTEQSYSDAAGGSVPDAKGVFAVRDRHNPQGWLLEERYLDADGKPMVNKDGVHSWKLDYDSWGRRTGLATFGLHDEPVPGIEKACAKILRYDERGNEIETTWRGPDGKPAANANGYAIARSQYDPQNNFAELAFFDADGKPCLGRGGFHRWVKTFDDRRNVIGWELRGTRDEPVLGVDGYAATRTEYDGRGKETRKTYLGTDGKPLVQSVGYAAYEQSYYPDGHLARVDYDGAGGERVLSNEGYCSFYDEYDGEGQLLSKTWIGIPGLTVHAMDREEYVNGRVRAERYLTADGQPVNAAVGYARIDIERDGQGNRRRIVYLDADGKPACGDSGFAGAEVISGNWKYYDANGRTMTDVEHDGVRPLMYVVFLRSRDCVAARAGLQPGDLIWQLGEFSYPRAMGVLWAKESDPAKFSQRLNEAWTAVLKPGMPTPVRVVVIRAGQPVELSVPTLPDGGIGVNVGLRRVPTAEYEAMVNRLGSTEPAR